MEIGTILTRIHTRFRAWRNSCDRLFLVLLLVNVILGFLWLDKPEGALIFDEKYYVNVARNLLRLPHDPSVYPDVALGVDPNREHPFLAKGIVALSMWLLGDDAWGWRTPSVIFGAISLSAFYLLTKRLSRSGEMALVASFLFSFSNLSFVHSRIATLDIFMLGFMMVSFYFYAAGRNYLSALFMALSTLSKVNGVFGFLVIIIFHFAENLIRGGKKPDWRPMLGWLREYAVTYAASVLLLLTVFDRIWGGYINPLDHISYMYNIHSTLTRTVPEGIESYPWQWLINEVKIPYLTVNVDVYVDKKLVSSRPSIVFQGAMNPLIVYLAIPAIAYCAYAAYKRKEETAFFTIIWFAATYLPFYPMSIIGHRIMYLFYFLPALPSVCFGISNLLFDRKTDRIVIMIYLFAVLMSFALLFPFKQIP